MEDINLLLSYIETEVLDGKKPFMGGGVIVNGEAILSLVKRVRLAFNTINGEELMAEANEHAKKIISVAEQRKNQILDENSIVTEARITAQQMLDEAYKRKVQMEEQLRSAVLKMLTDVKIELSSAERSVDETIARFKPDSRG